MKLKKITIAIQEAQRFIAIAETAVEKIICDEVVRVTGCKETSACRRASMDLTRALADMRKND